MFELGMRQAFDKPTVLIKDSKTSRIFDLSGFRDIEYDATLRVGDIAEKREAISQAIIETVDNRDNDNNVFSLVGMLGLAHAAQIPESKSNPESAQFQLLQRQLNAISETIEARLPKRPIAALPGSPKIVYRGGDNRGILTSVMDDEAYSRVTEETLKPMARRSRRQLRSRPDNE